MKQIALTREQIDLLLSIVEDYLRVYGSDPLPHKIQGVVDTLKYYREAQ